MCIIIISENERMKYSRVSWKICSDSFELSVIYSPEEKYSCFSFSFLFFYYYSAFSLICHRKRLTLRVNFSSVFYFKKNLISITCNAFRCIFNYDDANNFFRSIWMKMYCTFVCIYHNMKLTTFQNEHFPKQMHIIIIVATCITYMG